jgi:hypothetical protein
LSDQHRADPGGVANPGAPTMRVIASMIRYPL